MKHITSTERTAWNAKQATLSDTDILNKLKNVDGAGSGLDADLLDGRNATDFAYSGISAADLNTITQSGMYRIDANANAPGGAAYGQLLVIHGASDTITQIVSDYVSGFIYWRSGNPPVIGGNGAWGAWRKIWHDGNDGTGSGLDADLLRGYAPGAFATAAQGTKADNALPNTYGTISAVGTSITLSTGYSNMVVYTYSASAQIITIPTYAAAAIPVGTQMTFIQRSYGTVTFAPASGVNLESKDSKRSIDGLFASATLVYLGSDTWSLIGALV